MHTQSTVPSPCHCLLLTWNGAGCGVPIDLLAPHQLLVQVDHLCQVVIGLKDLSYKRREGEAS